MIHHGDCLKVMATMPAESVDAIVTDPPAGIAFMSKHWDRDKGGRTEWVAWMTDVMRECHRVLKPGGYAVVWSLPRTCHWTAWAMEDAGFIIRDQLAHIFASGFPKGRAQLKPAREDWWLARKPGPLRHLNIDACRIGTDEALSFSKAAPFTDANGNQGRTWNPTSTPGIEREQNPGGRWPSNVLLGSSELFDHPNPWVVGSGATKPEDGPDKSPASRPRQTAAGGAGEDPAGFGYSRFFIIPKADRADREPVLGGLPERPAFDNPNGNMGGNMGSRSGPRQNHHPTVKPTDLMRHLVRLVTPTGGTVLDPFLGSGTTAIACELEGFPWIGIEKEAEYVAIAEARLNGVQRGLGLDVPAPTKAPPKTHPDLSKHQPKRRAPAENWTGGWTGTDEEPAA